MVNCFILFVSCCVCFINGLPVSSGINRQKRYAIYNGIYISNKQNLNIDNKNFEAEIFIDQNIFPIIPSNTASKTDYQEPIESRIAKFHLESPISSSNIQRNFFRSNGIGGQFGASFSYDKHFGKQVDDWKVEFSTLYNFPETTTQDTPTP